MAPTDHPRSVNARTAKVSATEALDSPTAVANANVIDEAVKASTGNAGKDQGDKAKAALK